MGKQRHYESDIFPNRGPAPKIEKQGRSRRFCDRLSFIVDSKKFEIEEPRLGVFERRILRKMYGPTGSTVKPMNGENCAITNYKCGSEDPI